jgi:aspartyl-tRNA(Asn)/glutamyl-tRNA(Gln) amidotransferase subunit A
LLQSGAFNKKKRSDIFERSLQDINNLTIRHISKLIASRKISCLELVNATIERIEKLNPKLNAFITIRDQSAIREATVTKRLRKAGAIIVGTNNLHEFASGITGINPHYGPSRNPWDINRMSGGSSGGSAVAVSSGMSLASIGTDTSGSIRVPSSLCGIFGLKPTYGRVSRYGIMPLAPSIDHVGPLARSAWDIAVLLQAIAGYDKMDPSSSKVGVPDYLRELVSSERRDNNNDLEHSSGSTRRNFKIGIPKQFFFDMVEPKVMEIFRAFVDRLDSCGITTVSNVDVQGTDKIFETWRPIRLAEATSIHNEWIVSRRHEYGEDVRRMLEMGFEITAVKYINALCKWREEIKDAFLKAMSGYDALLVPTTTIPAPFLDQKEVNVGGKTIDVYSCLSKLTTIFNITGLPALNIPAGLVDSKLPVGVQLVGRPFDESRIIKIAYTWEHHYNLFEQVR